MQTCFNHYQVLRKEMDAWLTQSRRMDPPSKHGGGEDEANYTLAWFPHYLVTGNPEILEHFEYLRDMQAEWVARECVHGYEPKAEAHHGTEPFILFLPRFLGLSPDDSKARNLLEDAAHHIGNWVAETPDWFDWKRNRFYGYHIGNEYVNHDPEYSNEIAEHFRFLHLAIAAHRVVGDDRYLEWALQYGRRRASMLAEAPDGPLPVMWDNEGKPVWQKKLTKAQDKTSGSGHHAPEDPLVGVEVMLASGAIYVLGDLYLESGDSVFQEAAKRIVEPLLPELHDPYVDPGAAAISYYRQTFGDDSLDKAILDQIDTLPEQEGELAMVFPQVTRRSWKGVGKRHDMAYWGVWDDELGTVTPTTEPSTATLSLAYQVTGDTTFAERALRQASTKLKMARRVLRGGREHADMGGAICAVAAGHGRNWGTGAVTGCYGSLLLGTREIKSKVTPAVEVKHEDERPGLPADVLPLVVPEGTQIEGVKFYNGGESPATFSWRPEQGDWQLVTVQSEQIVECSLQGVMA